MPDLTVREWLALPTWADVIVAMERQPNLALATSAVDDIIAMGRDNTATSTARFRAPAAVELVKIARADGIESGRKWMIAQLSIPIGGTDPDMAQTAFLDLLLLGYPLPDPPDVDWLAALESYERSLRSPTLQTVMIAKAASALDRLLVSVDEKSVPPPRSDPEFRSRVLAVVGRLMILNASGNFVDNVERGIQILTEALRLAPPPQRAGLHIDLSRAYLSRTVQEPQLAITSAIDHLRSARAHPELLTESDKFEAAKILADALADLAMYSLPRDVEGIRTEQLQVLDELQELVDDDYERTLVQMDRAHYALELGLPDPAVPDPIGALRDAISRFDAMSSTRNRLIARLRLSSNLSTTDDDESIEEALEVARKAEALGMELQLPSETATARDIQMTCQLRLGNWAAALPLGIAIAQQAVLGASQSKSPIAHQTYSTILAVAVNDAAYASLRLGDDPFQAIALWDSGIGLAARTTGLALTAANDDQLDTTGSVRDIMSDLLKEYDAAVQVIVTVAGTAMVYVINSESGPRPQLVSLPTTRHDLQNALVRYSFFLAAQTDKRLAEDFKGRLRLLDAALEAARPIVEFVAGTLESAGLARGSRIAIAGSLGFPTLPLGAVKDRSGNLFGDYFRIRQIPSWTLAPRNLAYVPTTDDLAKSVVVADTLKDLPFAHVESDLVKDILKSRTLLRSRHATANRVREAIREGRGVAFFACHAFFSFEEPLASSIRLADRNWRASEIARNDLSQYDLAVLSSCESAVTDVRRAPAEYAGIRTALRHAGISHIVGSAWNVSDASTSLLLSRMLATWCSEGGTSDIESALWAAQRWVREATPATLKKRLIQVRRRYKWWRSRDRDIRNTIDYQVKKLSAEGPASKPWGHPYYWAAFTVW